MWPISGIAPVCSASKRRSTGASPVPARLAPDLASIHQAVYLLVRHHTELAMLGCRSKYWFNALRSCKLRNLLPRCLAWVVTTVRAWVPMFLVRLNGVFCLELITARRRAQARSRMATGHRGATRSVLDGGEHGARLDPRPGQLRRERHARDQPSRGTGPRATVDGYRSDFDAEARRLDIHLDFAAGGGGTDDAGCAAAHRPAHDTERMTWRHLNFFQHQAYPHARVPRVRCVRCGVKKISVPWAREGGASPCYRGVGHGLGCSNAGQRCGPTGG